MRLKERLTVNETLKRSLRRAFLRRLRRRAFAAAGATAGAAALLVALLWSSSLLPARWGETSHVLAADWSVGEMKTVARLDRTTLAPQGYAASSAGLYLSASVGGLYRLDGARLEKIADGAFGDIDLSPDGRTIVWSTGEQLGAYDLLTGEKTVWLKGGAAAPEAGHAADGPPNEAVYYERPVFQDAHTILLTRRTIAPRETHGFVVRASEIVAFDIRTHAVTVLGEGENPAPVPDKGGFVYVSVAREVPDPEEADEAPSLRPTFEIVYRDEGGQEKVIAHGKDPAVSPDGRYVAYVHVPQTGSFDTPDPPQDALEGVWLVDLDGRTARRLSFNVPAPNAIRQDGRWTVLPYYSYFKPRWAEDVRSLYVLQSTNVDPGGEMRLIRIALDDRPPGPAAVVRAYETATLRGDDFFALRLFPGDQLPPMSNPRKVGFAVLRAEDAPNGERATIDVAEMWSYTSMPYASMVRVRYTLGQEGGEWRILRNERLGEQSVALDERFDSPALVMVDEAGKQTLFPVSEAREAFGTTDAARPTAIAYLPKHGEIIIALADGGDSWIGAYDLEQGAFRLLDRRKGAFAARLLASPDERLLAAELVPPAGGAPTVRVYAADGGWSVDLGERLNADLLYFDEDGTLYTQLSAPGYRALVAWTIDAGGAVERRP